MFRISGRAVIVLVTVVVVIWACSSAHETPHGFKYHVVKNGDGKIPTPGQVLICDLSITDSKDSAWYDNRGTDYPEMIVIRDSAYMASEIGISEVFRYLTKGDSVEVPMSANDIFMYTWKMPVPDNIDPKSIFTFHVKVVDVLDSAEALRFRQKLDTIHNEKLRVQAAKAQAEMAIKEAELAEYARIQLGKDTVIIDNFLKEKGIKVQKTKSGLRYTVKSRGDGPTPKPGMYVLIKYTGNFFNGEMFDTGEAPFSVGQGDVIAGWDEICLLMKKGTSLTVYVPSSLAYGKDGRAPKIPGDAILVFEMEMVDFKAIN